MLGYLHSRVKCSHARSYSFRDWPKGAKKLHSSHPNPYPHYQQNVKQWYFSPITLSRIGNESNWPRGRETLSPIQEISSGHLIVVPKTNSRALKFGVWIAIFPLMFCSFLFSCFAFLSRVNSNWQLPRRQVKWWIPFSCRSLLSDAL